MISLQRGLVVQIQPPRDIPPGVPQDSVKYVNLLAQPLDLPQQGCALRGLLPLDVPLEDLDRPLQDFDLRAVPPLLRVRSVLRRPTRRIARF